MFAAAFPNASLDHWTTKSVVAHAVSRTGPVGPYEYQGVILGPRSGTHYWDASNCHNPTVHKIGEEYVIFYIGMDYTDHPYGGQGDPWQAIGAAYSTSPYGPWNRTDKPLLVSTLSWECHPECGVSNPAVTVLSDGSLVMVYRGNSDRGVGVATAPHWRGPWTKANNKTSIFPPDVVVGLEDAYIWRNPTRPGCQMVLHQEEQGGANVGAHAYTLDATCTTGWVLSQPRPSHAYSLNVTWASGEFTTMVRRERPQMIFDEEGYPTHLFSAVQPDNTRPTKTHTIVVPLGAPDRRGAK
eukprot:Hpha_TRINITY_DN3636_c0_g1::TRINITY_DN3636_c0_g1_i1::g.939::m.939